MPQNDILTNNPEIKQYMSTLPAFIQENILKAVCRSPASSSWNSASTIFWLKADPSPAAKNHPPFGRMVFYVLVLQRNILAVYIDIAGQDHDAFHQSPYAGNKEPKRR